MMNEILLKIMQINILLIVFYSFYAMLLRKLTFFKMNRFYLLFAIAASIIIPFINISFSNEAIPFQEVFTIETFNNEFINYNTYNEQNVNFQSIKPLSVLSAAYFIVVALFLMKSVYAFLYILKKAQKHKKTVHGKHSIIWHADNSAFSFFNLIFIPQKVQFTGEYKNILMHEKAHAKQLHSIDLVLMELVTAFFWFNPFVYFLKKSVKQTHEFLADRYVMNSGIKPLEYITNLKEEFFKMYAAGLVTNFKTKSIKRRLIMITKNNSKKSSVFKYFLAIPLAAILLVCISSKTSTSLNIESRMGIAIEKENPPSIFPIDNKAGDITAGFGMRKHPINGKMSMHNGVDIAAPEGTDVYATADGKVITAENKKGWGNLIVIEHGKTYKTYYSHLKDFNVKVGDKVKKGDIIGYVGNTGISLGSHLHYEVSKNGEKVNPKKYF